MLPRRSSTSLPVISVSKSSSLFLAIVANYGQYPIRLNKAELQQKSCSFHLSILVMCLLTVEILNNGTTEVVYPPSFRKTVCTFLQTQFFNEFHGPRIDRSLTFKKGFSSTWNSPHVASGPKGHLWKLGKIVRTA